MLKLLCREKPRNPEPLAADDMRLLRRWLARAGGSTVVSVATVRRLVATFDARLEAAS